MGGFDFTDEHHEENNLEKYSENNEKYDFLF